MKLNEKIAYYRRQEKLSQEELAARTGVSRQAVSKWELGEASPDIGKLLALAQAFGVTTDHLLDDSAGPEPPAPPPQQDPAPPPPAPGSDLPGFLGKMVRRWGWLAGVYLALQGLGVTLLGLLARWGFGSIFSASRQMMAPADAFGLPGGWSYSGPPELEGAFLEAMGAVPQASPLSGIQSFFLGFATVVLVAGLLLMLGGCVLAYVLWSRRTTTTP